MKKVCVVTATRAEYGLLYPVLKLINDDKELELQLVVSGTHLSYKYGYTKNEIINDGFSIAAEIDILQDSEKVIPQIVFCLNVFTECPL